MKTVLTFIYGIGAGLSVAGLVMTLLGNSSGKYLIFAVLLFTSIIQGFMIDKLFKKLKDKENQLE